MVKQNSFKRENSFKEKIKEVLERAIEKIYPSKEALEKVILSGRKLTIYLGVDPTSPHLHLGHAVNLLVLKRFQKLGHKVIFLVGDFTARIGDPSGRLAGRKPLTEEEVKKNFKTFKSQVSRIISFSGTNPAKIKFNSSWYKKMALPEFIKLAQIFTLQQMIERDMFQKRLKTGRSIGLGEFLYPLLQGYDSAALDVEAEIGGVDQTFNMLVGRTLLKILKNKEKFVLAVKLLVNPRTGRKISKSEGGLINLDDSPKEMFGKVMAFDDEGMFVLAELCTEMDIKRFGSFKKQVAQNKINPRDAKTEIAFEIVKLYWNKKEAQKARKEFFRIFSQKKMPEEMPAIKIAKKAINILDLLTLSGVKSKSEARRLIFQDAVKINKEVVKDWRIKIKIINGMIIQVGKRKFVKITSKV